MSLEPEVPRLPCHTGYSGFVHRETSPHGRTRRFGVLVALLAGLLGVGLTACAQPPVDLPPTTTTTATPTDSPASTAPDYNMGTESPLPPITASDTSNSQQTIDRSTVTLPPASDLAISASMVLDTPYKVVRVVATITNIVSGDGQCQITVGNYSTSVAIVANATNSSCQINQIPIGQIKMGDSFTVTATSGGLTGTTSGKVQ
ncbi:MAG: hypothetical protein FWF36_07235 [Propionibacteriaceae bacterium]|nr:hypothetical protein [Propionibacteriaceae bacterium]